MDKTLLILGAGPDQIPGILKAKEMGLYLIALDGNDNAPGKKYVDEFYTVSIKHLDQINTFLKNNQLKKIDGVIAFGVDIPYITSVAADFFNVNYTISSETALRSENKYEAKVLMEDLGINIPPFNLIKNITELKKFIDKESVPVIIKPVDNSAARGISYINDYNKLANYFETALSFSKSQGVIVEKFLSGYQISSESFIIDGKVFNIGLSDRNYSRFYDFLPNIIEDGGDMPSIYMKEKHKKQLTHYLELIAERLNIKNGVVKGDLIIHNDELYFVEFALRLSGGNFSTIEIPESTGVDFIKVAIKLHLNLLVSKSELFIKNNENICLRYLFTEDINKKGKIEKLCLPIETENIICSNMHCTINDQLPKKTTDHSKRLGFVVAKGKYREQAVKNAQKYLDNIKIVVE